ncbi:MAG TPA: NAD(P)/FAD-dependent oxidoreductase [Candidatus Angelobacter sp.]|nr:NAD(P)/FAD-dependent oxidoreductase [Candidatus Angelobacter sp.]
MHIAIFGAGIAGLMSAITLRRQGHRCSVYERSRLAHDAGMGFILMPAAIDSMDRLGIQLRGVPLERYVCRSNKGEVLYEETIPPGSRGIRRRELIGALADAAKIQDGITFDAELKLLEFDEHGHVTTAVLSSGERITAELFVAADGAHSQARHALFPNWPLHQARVAEVVGLVHCPQTTRWAGHNLNKFHAADGGLAVGILPVDPDHIVWFMQFDSLKISLPSNRDAGSREWRDFVQKLARECAFPVAHLPATTESRLMHVWYPLDTDLVPSFHRQNLVLVGDAAHPLSPFTSQGVSSAIADAVALAHALPSKNESGALVTGLASYSSQRRKQCAPYLSKGRELMQRFLAPVNSDSFMLPLAR